MTFEILKASAEDSVEDAEKVVEKPLETNAEKKEEGDWTDKNAKEYVKREKELQHMKDQIELAEMGLAKEKTELSAKPPGEFEMAREMLVQKVQTLEEQKKQAREFEEEMRMLEQDPEAVAMNKKVGKIIEGAEKTDRLINTMNEKGDFSSEGYEVLMTERRRQQKELDGDENIPGGDPNSLRRKQGDLNYRSGQQRGVFLDKVAQLKREQGK